MELILLIVLIVGLCLHFGITFTQIKALGTKVESVASSLSTSLSSKVTTEVAAVKTTLAEHGGVLATLEDKAENVLTGAVAEKVKSDLDQAKADAVAAYNKLKALVEPNTTTTAASTEVPAASAAGTAAGFGTVVVPQPAATA